MAGGWGGDIARLAIARESAGGNLPVATAIAARDGGLTAPRHILAVYPIANSSDTLPSRTDRGAAKPLNTPMLKWVHALLCQVQGRCEGSAHRSGARETARPAAGDHRQCTDRPAAFDGETLAAALKAAGVEVEQRTFEGVTHEIFGMGAVVRGAKDAEQYA